MIEIYSNNKDGVWFSVACAQQQIVASTFAETQQRALNNILGNIPFNVPFEVFHEPSIFSSRILAFLKNIYDGQEIDASFPLALTQLPTYTQKVLKATCRIPLGYIASYGSIAQAIGGGPRAVGNVMASNPFAPIVPCHRVVKSDFTLGGYGGGLRVKLEFLIRERRGFSLSKKVDVNGQHLQVFPVEYALGTFG